MMRRLILLLLLLVPSLQAQTYTCRTDSVVPGDSCYVWFPAGGNLRPPQLSEGWTFSRPATISNSEWHNQWAWAIRVSDRAKPGVYPVGDIEITVVKKPKPRPLLMLQAGRPVGHAQSFLNQGYDLELGPGIHRWDAALVLPDGASLTSAGAWIIREPDGDYGERMFIPLGAFTLDGLLLTHSPSITSDRMIYVHSYPPRGGNVSVRNCVIRGGSLSHQQGRGWVVEDCRFERAGTGHVADHSVWLRCSFTGTTRQNHHAFFNTGVPCLTASLDFENTNRAFVLQGTAHGQVSLDSTCRGIQANGTIAGSEVVLLETGENVPLGQGIRDNTFIDVSMTGCSGPGVSLYGSGHTRNRFWGIDSHVENVSLLVCAFGGRMDENEFNNMQCTGGLDLRGNIGRLTLSNVQLIEGVQRRGNSGPFTANLKHLNDNWPIYSENVEGDIKFFGSGIWSTGGKWKELKGIR